MALVMDVLSIYLVEHMGKEGKNDGHKMFYKKKNVWKTTGAYGAEKMGI